MLSSPMLPTQPEEGFGRLVVMLVLLWVVIGFSKEIEELASEEFGLLGMWRSLRRSGVCVGVCVG